MKVVAFLPAKGTSSRIECKNKKLLNGKPLFLHTLEKLCDCDFIDEVYLDSEDDEILDFADYLPYKKLKRDPALANNKTDGHQMFYNEVKQVEADIYIQILGTSPFIKKETIKHGIDVLLENDKYDSVVLVKKDKQYTWSGNQPVYDKYHIPNSVDLPDTIIETMGLYIVRAEAAKSFKMRFGNNTYLLEAEPIEAVDVNFPLDFEFAEIVASGYQQKEIMKLKVYSNFLSSALLSDVLFEYGVSSTIAGLTTNFPNKKVFGRANTLKIRKLNTDEDYRGIYDGLKTYEKIRPGEIIVVDNDVDDKAYFGELNCNLAVRSGAICTIIDGVTRDIKDVNDLDYPVYSKGYCCKDVKGVATVDYHNKPITIQGVTINPGDLVFADINGIVVIPHKIEKEVIAKALHAATVEKNVLSKILGDENAIQIYNEEGEF